MRVLILESNLLWSARLANAARTLGHDAVVAKAPVDGEFHVAIVNLGEANVDWSVRVSQLQRRGMKVVGHAGHKEKELHEIGRAAGCDLLVTNSELANKLSRVLADVTKQRLRVAITGGVAEGKSTVLAYLAQQGRAVTSADDIAKGVFDSEAIQAWLAQELGIAPDRSLVRAKVAEDPHFRRRLNEMTHPLILEALKQSPAEFFEVPLLIETCSQVAFDRIWVVTCGPEEQRRRLAARLNSASKAEDLLRTQLPTRAKIPFADVILRTNMDEETVRRNVFAAATQI